MCYTLPPFSLVRPHPTHFAPPDACTPQPCRVASSVTVHPLAPTVPSDVRILLQGLDLLPPPSGALSVRSPERLLGDALSLAETVRLGAELNQAGLERESDSDAQRAALELRQHCSDLAATRLNALRRRLEQIYGRAFSTPSGLPNATRMHTMLVDMGALGDAPAARAKVSKMWAASYGQLFAGSIARLRRELELFKPDLVQQLREQVPATSALLQIDAVLDSAIGRLMHAAVQRLCASFEARCAARFERAIAALPPDCDAASLQPLLSPRGTATRLLELGRRLAQALLDLEWSALQGLIDAVCAETSSAPGAVS